MLTGVSVKLFTLPTGARRRPFSLLAGTRARALWTHPMAAPSVTALRRWLVFVALLRLLSGERSGERERRPNVCGVARREHIGCGFSCVWGSTRTASGPDLVSPCASSAAWSCARRRRRGVGWRTRRPGRGERRRRTLSLTSSSLPPSPLDPQSISASSCPASWHPTSLTSGQTWVREEKGRG